MVNEGVPTNLYSFRGGGKLINCVLVEVDEDGENFYVGTSEGQINVWDLKITRMVKSVKVGESAILSIIKTSDGFLTQEKASSIKFWDRSWTLLKSLDSEDFGFCKMVSNDDFLFYPASDGKVKLYNKKDGTEKIIFYKFNKNPGQVMSLFCLEDVLLVLYEGGFLSSWDLSGIKTSEIDIDGTPMCFDFCRETSQGIVGSSSDVLTRFDFFDKKLSITKTTKITNAGVSSLTIHNSGKIFVAGCWDGAVKYFSMKTLKLLAAIANKPESIQTVKFCHHSLTEWGPNVVFVAGPEDKISLCNLYSKELSLKQK